MLCVAQQFTSEIVFHPSVLEKNRVMSVIVKLVGGEKNDSLDHKHMSSLQPSPRKKCCVENNVFKE